VKLDATPPTASGAVNNQPNQNGWYNTIVTVTFSGTDALSGVATCTTPVQIGEGANQATVGQCHDKAGNVSEPADVGPIDVDLTDPVVGFAGLATSYRLTDSIAIACTASDAMSGVEFTTCSGASGFGYEFDHAAPNGVRSAATDYAGNTASTGGSFAIEVTREGVDFVIDEYVGDDKVARGLKSDLDKVTASESKKKDKGKTEKKLDGFEDAVESGVAVGALTPQQGRHLLDLAASLVFSEVSALPIT
jgi:hypothetical protein